MNMATEWTKKLVGSEDDRAVSPVIGVILMVAITVILAAVIAAFVLDIGPGDNDPTAAVDVSDNGTDAVTVGLTSLDSGSTDGVAIVAEENVDDDESERVFDDGEVLYTLSTSGAERTVEWDADEDEWTSDGEADEDGWNVDNDQVEFTVRSYAGTLDAGDDVDDADGQAIEEEFTLVDD